MTRTTVSILATLGLAVAPCVPAAAETVEPPARPAAQARRFLTLEELQALKAHPGFRTAVRAVPGAIAPIRTAVATGPHLAVRWQPTGTYGSGEPWGNACGINGWIYEWGVENTGNVASQPAWLLLTCELVGGGSWPSGQLQFLQQRLCGCMGKFYVPMVPAHATRGFGIPEGLRFRSFQGLDQRPCNDPQYPHAKVTATLGDETAVVEFCY